MQHHDGRGAGSAGFGPAEVTTADRLSEVVDLVAAAVPHEAPSPDELLAVLWEQDGVVFTVADAAGDLAGVIGAVRVEQDDAAPLVQVTLVAVHPGDRRTGVARRLVAATEAWAEAGGASEMRFGGLAPAELWPGVDPIEMPAMVCLAEAAGYQVDGTLRVASVPTSFRHRSPGGIEIHRVLDDRDAEVAEALAARAVTGGEAAAVVGRVRRGVDHGCCHLAVGADGAVGLVCHSVNRSGWIDPVLVAPRHRRSGIGAALVGRAAEDLMVAGVRAALLPTPPGAARFAAALGGAPARVFQVWVKPLGLPTTGR